MQIWKDYIENNRERFVMELFELLRIPSISAKSEHNSDMLKCANLLKQRLLEAGADVANIYTTDRYPIVYGEKIIDPSLPTVLVYGHYDVQPAEPLELWHNNPFEPVITDGKIYARGSCDDKGQLYMHIKALELLIKTNTLCTNIKFCIEGEEEIGSPSLTDFVKDNKNLLKADCVVISDSAMISFDTPSIDIGQRGLTYVEIEVAGPERDLHSGIYGGAVANPINILVKLLASLQNENNQIAIPGIYDDVVVTTTEERRQLALTPFNESAYKDDLGVTELWGEKEFSTVERTGIRPSLDINGIWGGYTGEGTKTVLPSKAFAKISIRTVPNQQSERVIALLINHLEKNKPECVTMKTNVLIGDEPYLTPVNSKAYQAAVKAIEMTFGKTPVPLRNGGSIPICTMIEKELGIPVVFMGFGFDSDNIHSPNEKFGIANFYKGIETIPYFHKFFSELMNTLKKKTMRRLKWVDRSFNFEIPFELLPNILERLRGTTARIKEMTLSLSEKEAGYKPEGNWSVKEQIGHLSDLEMLHEKRIDDFIEKERLSAADMSNTATNNANHNNMLILQLIKTFEIKRVECINRIEILNDETQLFKSLHPRLNTLMKPVDLCFFIAEHDDHHLLSIREILKDVSSIK